MSETLWPAIVAIAADPRFPYAVAISALAGLVRGFTGFGSALIYVPLMAVLYGPLIAAPTILLFDTLCTLPLAIRAWKDVTRREVVPVSLGGMLVAPLGVMALLWLDPLLLRWFIAALVLGAAAALITGWRYRGRPTVATSFGVGALAGFGAGAVQIGGPPVLVFWLGGDNNAATVRANVIVYFVLQGLLSMVLYAFTGVFTRDILIIAALLAVPFVLAMMLGASWFHGSSETLYRKLSYAIIAIAGIVSLPIFDSFR